MLSPSTAAHDQTVKLAASERSGVKECWFVHPTDRTVAVYLFAGSGYGRPAISELQGSLAARCVPAAVVDWSLALRAPGKSATA